MQTCHLRVLLYISAWFKKKTIIFIAQIHVSFLLKEKKVRYTLQDLKKKIHRNVIWFHGLGFTKCLHNITRK